MQPTGWNDPSAVNALVEKYVPFFSQMVPADRERLREIAADLQSRGLPAPFIESSLRSTADVLRELRSEEERADNVFRREEVQRFIQENAVADTSVPYHPRRERKREERERLQANTLRLLREARTARGRHEVKKTRSMLLKLDQRELRRVLGREGDDLCRQINTWLRTTASMF